MQTTSVVRRCAAVAARFRLASPLSTTSASDWTASWTDATAELDGTATFDDSADKLRSLASVAEQQRSRVVGGGSWPG